MPLVPEGGGVGGAGVAVGVGVGSVAPPCQIAVQLTVPDQDPQEVPKYMFSKRAVPLA